MKSRIEGSWTGWRGDTVVKLANGSVWRQAQYRYRPDVIVNGNDMYVDGMSRAVRVRRIG